MIGVLVICLTVLTAAVAVMAVAIAVILVMRAFREARNFGAGREFKGTWNLPDGELPPSAYEPFDPPEPAEIADD